MGRLEASVTSFRKAIVCKAELPEAHLNLGNTYLKLYNFEEAAASYRKALALRPNYARAHGNLGIALRELGRLQEAVTSFKKALELNPDYQICRANLGTLLHELGRFEQFSECYQQISKQVPITDSREKKPGITCLLIHGRSGTMFLHSLFDGHPSLATLPGVYFKGWFSPDSWERFIPYLEFQDWKQCLVNIFMEQYSPLFDANSQKNVFGEPLGHTEWLARDIGFTKMGPQGNEVFKIDKDLFSKTLISLLEPFETITSDSFLNLYTSF